MDFTSSGPAAPDGLTAVNRLLIAVAAGLIGLGASVGLYLGLGHAVPLVDWGDDATQLLRSKGALQVRIAALYAGLAGALLLGGRAWWTGGAAVAVAGLLAVLAEANSIASWALLLIYVVVLLAGCAAVAGRRAEPTSNGFRRRSAPGAP